MIYRLDDVTKLFPGARIIHIVRDGRAVFSSNLMANKIKLDLNLKAKFPSDAYGSYYSWKKSLDHTKRLAGKGHYFEVRYEFLLQNPRHCLEKLCAFLGLQFEGQMLKYYLKNKHNKWVPDHRLHWHKKTIEELDINRSTAWKDELPQKALLRYEFIGRRTLRTYGYEVAIRPKHFLALDAGYARHFLRTIFKAMPGPVVRLATAVFKWSGSTL